MKYLFAPPRTLTKQHTGFTLFFDFYEIQYYSFRFCFAEFFVKENRLQLMMWLVNPIGDIFLYRGQTLKNVEEKLKSVYVQRNRILVSVPSRKQTDENKHKHKLKEGLKE